MRIQFFFLVIALSGASSNILTNPLSDEFIDHINNQQSTWTAGRNFKENTPLSHLYGLVGSRSSLKAIPMNVHVHSENVGIPESFDARENWPRCRSIKVIKDQSACGSCWAVAPTSMMSDRICIHSNGKKQIFVSDEDLLSCCDHCGAGCVGGFPWEALHWWHTDGIVSGGSYNSTVGCKAYSMPPCDHLSIGTKPECPDKPYDTPECQKQCDPQSSLAYDSDKSFGRVPYGVNADGNLTRVQLDILINGPIVASFLLFEDFFSYKSGVYQHIAGENVGEHAVKILGWGVEKGTPYWLVANSWNEDWGDKGFFKILRGKNECNVEFRMIASLPKL